jgi:hypothetical protein
VKTVLQIARANMGDDVSQAESESDFFAEWSTCRTCPLQVYSDYHTNMHPNSSFFLFCSHAAGSSSSHLILVHVYAHLGLIHARLQESHIVRHATACAYIESHLIRSGVLASGSSHSCSRTRTNSRAGAFRRGSKRLVAKYIRPSSRQTDPRAVLSYLPTILGGCPTLVICVRVASVFCAM